MNSSQPAISSQAIARSFSAAAGSYDAHADLQRAVVDALLAFGQAVESPRHILDLGSGTGYCSRRLQARWPQAHLTNLDIAEGMLRFHRGREKAGDAGFICADMACLPFRDASFDHVFSSLSLQWCARPAEVFRELSRVGKSGCRVLVSTLGPATLQEVRELWHGIDAYRHVNEFQSLQNLIDQAQAAGLDVVCSSVQPWRRHYAELKDLALEMKGLGAHNLNHDQPPGLTGRARWRQLETAFARAARDGVFTTTFDVVLLELETA